MSEGGPNSFSGVRAGIRAALVVNTNSRKGAALYDEARKRLSTAGFDLVASLSVRPPGCLAEAVRDALALDPSLLVVGGGDGTVSEVAGRLAYRETALGVLPLGTTNNFARNLGLPLDLDSAIDVLERGRVADVDLGCIGGHYFGNVASIGLTVEVARNVSASLKRRMGRAAYLITGAREFARHLPFEAVVRTDDGERRLRTHQLIIANGAFHAGRRIADDATVEDHRLTIFRIGNCRRSSAFGSLLSYELRRARSVHDADFISVSEALILTEPERDIEIDGEVLARTPVACSVARGALHVMVPCAFGEV